MKINVIGTSGSGKSTVAQQLASLLNVSYIQLDALFWKQNWQQSSDDEFTQKLTDALTHATNDGWVIDGNYSRINAIKWRDVEMVVWLDYSLPRTLYQSVTRTIARILSKEELWAGTGNIENWKQSFFSKDSVILWSLKTYKLNKKRNIKLMVNRARINNHVQFIRLTSPQETKLFLTLMREQKNIPSTH